MAGRTRTRRCGYQCWLDSSTMSDIGAEQSTMTGGLGWTGCISEFWLDDVVLLTLLIVIINFVLCCNGKGT